VRACKGIVSTYLRVYDESLQEAEEAAAAQAAQQGADAEAIKAAQKREKLKKKREAAKAAKKAEEEKKKQEEQHKNKPKEETTRGGKKREEDDDPDGEKLLAKAPLPEASTWVKELLLYSYDNVDAHLLAGQVFSRSKKYLLWLRSLRFAHNASPNRAEVLEQRIQLVHALETNTNVHETVRKVIDGERTWLGTSARAILEATETKELGHAFVLAKGHILCDKNSKAASLGGLSAFDVAKDPTSSFALCSRVLEYLEQEAPAEQSAAFKARCAKKFDCSPRFMDTEAANAFRTSHVFPDPITAEHSALP